MESSKTVRVVMNGKKTIESAQSIVLGSVWDEFVEKVRTTFHVPSGLSVHLYTCDGASATNVEEYEENDVLILCLDEEAFIPCPELIQETRKVDKAAVSAVFKQVKEAYQEYKTAAELIDFAAKSLDEATASVKGTINKSFDDIIAAINVRRQQVLSEADEIKKKKVANLDVQKKSILEVTNSIRQLPALEAKISADQSREFGTIHKQLLSYQEIFSTRSLSMLPCEDDVITFEANSAIVSSFTNFGTLKWNSPTFASSSAATAASTAPAQPLAQDSIPSQKTASEVTIGNLHVKIVGGASHIAPIHLIVSSLDESASKFAYQWYRQELSAPYIAIPGASKDSYQPSANDIHAHLRVAITPISSAGARAKPVNVDIPLQMLALDPHVQSAVEENITLGECIFDVYRKNLATKKAEERSLWFSTEGITIKVGDDPVSCHTYGPVIRVILPAVDATSMIVHFDLETVEEIICPSPLYRDILALTIRSFNALAQVENQTAPANSIISLASTRQTS
eukprot:TRINITY_DN2951_c0_g1_i1.p1 TRINITY_DN2951_c0_g1~~TRINITY_DN2951_c0_g1_i1.p1  ORF type:complete len:512 (+),score=118.33 TRINITY_DN2951_c0_g1_i1:58-1593(+)